MNLKKAKKCKPNQSYKNAFFPPEHTEFEVGRQKYVIKYKSPV